MQRHVRFWVVLSSLGVATVSAIGHAALSSASESHVTFDAVGPAGFKIQGTTQDLSVSEADGNVVVSVPLANLATGISLRDHHMKEKYLEVAKYPVAVLTVPKGVLKIPQPGGQVDADVPGSLTLHGQTHPVSVHYTAKGDGGTNSAQGKFHVNMTDFGIVVPSYLGVTVKPDVEVSASFRVAGN